MTSHTHYLGFNTKSRQEIIDITDEVAEQVRESGVAEGLALVSAMHITASVFVNDHESGLWADILKWLETTIAPWGPKRDRHNEKGGDNAAGPLRSPTSGDRLAVDLPNWPEWVVTLLAAAYRSVVLVPLDPSLTAHELKYQLRHAEVRAAVVAETYEGSDLVELYDEILPDLPELRALILVGGTDRWLDDRVYRYADLVSKRSAAPGVIAPGDPASQPLAILYTSGTMGKPKGVVVSHDNITMTARASSQALGTTGEDRVLGAVPVFTIFGMHVVAVTITAGATLVLQERFDAAGALALIRRERVTIVHGVPTMFELLMRDPSFEESKPTTCRSGLVAGSPVSPDLAGRIRQWCDVQIAYGLTETGPTVTVTRFEDSPERRTHTVGRPIAGVSVKVVDLKSGVLHGPEAVGELAVEGPERNLGYYPVPRGTAPATTAQGV